jgi:hypothetical protein
VRVWILGRVVQAAEAARIVEAQRDAGVEHEIDVIVRHARGAGRQYSDAARHP